MAILAGVVFPELCRFFAAALEDGKANALDSSASTCLGCSVWSMFSNGSRDLLTDICCCSSALASSSGSCSHYKMRSIFFSALIITRCGFDMLTKSFPPALTVSKNNFRDIAACAVSTCKQLSQKRRGLGVVSKSRCGHLRYSPPPPLKSYLHSWC